MAQVIRGKEQGTRNKGQGTRSKEQYFKAISTKGNQ